MARRLRPEQREVDHIQPAQNAVDDCPKYRMVGSVGYRDSKGGTKADAVFRSLDSNPVVTVSFHDYLGCRILQLSRRKAASPVGGRASLAHYAAHVRRPFHQHTHV